ncbi:hypothetical protein ACIU1J_11275 [Azospirillum doebereinerae]|uniref:hypothetical protein n=1 Tax=Azospirillum doebereinerae TaxID=92933 RepID=UPI001EE56B56|nr:hypothetical protein [Azospirillum doebereinerae]MCG5243996.1 hypothetical protein [Azospirillum doebereinerae]
MRTYAETINTTPYLDDLERQQALAVLLDELEEVAAQAAALRPGEDAGDALDALSRVAVAPLATSPAAHAALRRAWGRLVLAGRRHARLLARYGSERPASPLAPGVRPGVLTLVTLLVSVIVSRRLLLPPPLVWWPPSLADDAAAIGRPLPPAVEPAEPEAPAP